MKQKRKATEEERKEIERDMRHKPRVRCAVNPKAGYGV